MTPEALRILRLQLPPYGEGARPSGEMQAFCRFYAIDFTERRASLEHLVGYVDSGDYRVAMHCWRQPEARANLLVVHGYYDHVGLFGKLIGWGLEKQCNVVAFDLPGHGLSSGDSAVIGSFTDYSRAIADVLSRVRLPDLPLCVIAQSTGCAALMEFARQYQWPFAATVFLAPLVRPAGWRGIQLAYKLLSPVVDSIPRTFAQNSSDSAFLEFVRSDPLQCHRVPLAWVGALRAWLADLEQRDLGVGPVLLVQGDGDHTVDWRYNVPAVQQMFPGTSVECIAGAGHQLANESGEIRRRYLEQAQRHLAQAGVFLGQVNQTQASQG